MYRRMYKGDHPDLALSMHNVASVLHDIGRLSEAEPLYLQALEMDRRLYPGDHPRVANDLSDLGFVQRSQGRFPDAEPLMRQSLEMQQRLFPGDHPVVSSGLNNLASTWQEMGRAAEAEPLFVSALEMKKRLSGADGQNPSIALSLNNLARCRVILDKLDDADRDGGASVLMYERLFPTGHPRRAVAISTLAMVRFKQGKPDEARKLLTEAQAMLGKNKSPAGLQAQKIAEAELLILGSRSSPGATSPASRP
jgi:tetratricopeptide (TPR) repeat protein